MDQPTIQRFIEDIRNGALLLPEFQREYVWKRDKAKEFIRSVYKSYPTGSVLIWQTQKPPLTRGAQQVSGDQIYTQLLLDGQQRLTTVYTLFTGEPPAFYDGDELYFDLHFNLETEEFQYYTAPIMKGNPLWIKVTDFLKQGINDFLDKIGSLPSELSALYLHHIKRFNKLDNIRNYTYQVQTLRGEELDTATVVDIFNKVNSGGRPLSDGDLALAHVCSHWPELRGEMRKLSEQLVDHKFQVSMTFMTRCLNAVATERVKFDSLYTQSTEALKQAWQKITRILPYLVNILPHHAYIESSDDISENALVPLVAYLGGKPSLAFDSQTEMNKYIHWLYLALTWGRYSGSTLSALEQDVSSIKTPDPSHAWTEAIRLDRGRLHVTAEDLHLQGRSSSFYRIACFVARRNKALDWQTGQPIYGNHAGMMNKLEVHHIFPKAYLKRHGVYTQEKGRQRVNCLANFAFITKGTNIKIKDKAPKDYLPGISEQWPCALSSQHVPENKSLWTIEMYDEFLATRNELLAEAINSRLDELKES